MQPRGYVRALTLAWVFLAVQLSVGCRWEVCLGFSIALFFGWCACESARPWRSVFGLLTISLYVKAVLFGCLAKSLLLQPMDEGVRAPATTAAVFALGFAGVWLAVLLLRRLPLPARPVIWNPSDSRSLLVVWGVFLLLGGAGYAYIFLGNIAVVVKDEAGVAMTLSRWYHLPSVFATIFPFAPAAAVFYLSARRKERLISHPLVIVSLLVSVMPGLLEGRKNPIMIPFASVWLSVLLLRGARYKPLWIWTAACLIVLLVLVYPFVQYSRYAVQEGPVGDRLDVLQNTGQLFFSREGYRAMYGGALKLDEANKPYLPPALAALDRLVLYVFASHLVAATVDSGNYTGFFTIEWGLRQIPPRMFYPDKPLGFVNNWLARYTGDASQTDERTQMAYGFMASCFNAFGYAGAFFGSFVLFSVMVYWLRLFVDTRAGPGVWVVAAFFLADSGLVENSAGALLPSVWLPVTFLLCGLALNVVCSAIRGRLLRVRRTGKRRPSSLAQNSTIPLGTR